MVFAWSGLFVARLCSLKRSRSVLLVSPIYCFLPRENSFSLVFTSFTLDHTMVSRLMIFRMNQLKKGEGKITYQK